MGILNHLFSRTDDPEIDHYVICHADESGGWVPVDGWGRLETRFSPLEFEVNEAPLKPGKYRLFAVDKRGRRRQPSRGEGEWPLEVDENGNVKNRNDIEW